VDFDEDLFVGEAAHAGVGQRKFQIVRDRTGKRPRLALPVDGRI
jgi:hypothetical protein